nr:hypothetical protein CFP56_66568 [Quercus suber]
MNLHRQSPNPLAKDSFMYRIHKGACKGKDGGSVGAQAALTGTKTSRAVSLEISTAAHDPLPFPALCTSGDHNNVVKSKA